MILRSLSLLLPAMTAVPATATASDFSLSGEARLVSRYVDEDLLVYSRRPAFQPELNISHDPSGCYVGAWGSKGLWEKAGDEIDLYAGCERSFGPVTLDAFAARYFFRDGAMTAFSARAEAGGVSLRGEYYVPDEGGEAEGLRLVAGYERELGPVTLGAILVHDTGPYDGMPPITNAGVEAGFALAPNVRLSGTLLAPVAKREGDGRKAQAWAGLGFSF